VFLPQQDGERPSGVVGDAQKVLPRVAGPEVVPPASQERINPFPYKVREIPVLATTDRLPDFLLDGIHRPGRGVVIRPNRAGALGGLHNEAISEEVERLLAGVHYPCFLFIEG